MLTNIRLMIQACQELNIPYQIFHQNQNILKVYLQHQSYFFVNYSTPLLSQATAQILKDKGYTYEVLKNVIAMPKTSAFLSPFADEKYRQYLDYPTFETITEAILDQFQILPVILKRNRGSSGNHVFLCRTVSEINSALQQIFNLHHKDYDYIALAQAYLNIKKEYRVVCLEGKIELIYHKNMDNAVFEGNLSPLHWQGATAEKITNMKLIQTIQKFIDPIFAQIDLPYCGLDLVLDTQGKWWLVEINSHPNYNIFIRDNSEKIVINLFRKILKLLSQFEH